MLLSSIRLLLFHLKSIISSPLQFPHFVQINLLKKKNNSLKRNVRLEKESKGR